RLASASADETVKVWDFHNDQDSLTLRQSEPVVCLGFPSGGKQVASGFYGVTLRDISSGKPIHFLGNFPFNLDTECMAFSQDGSRLAYPNLNEIQIWDVKRARKVAGIKTTQQFLTRSLALNPDGSLLAFPRGGGVAIVNVATGKEVWTFP